jgi:hypothetical protein
VKLFIPIFCIPISAFISKSIIISNSSPDLTSQLYTLYKLAINVIFTALNLIFNYPSLKLAVAIYNSLPTGHPLFYIPCDPYIPI